MHLENSIFVRFHVSSALKSSNAYKKKGIPVTEIFQYLFLLIFSNRSMYMNLITGRNTPAFAKDALEDWKTVKNSTDDVIIVNKFIKLIVRTALECGFFSVWMTVFSEENEIKKALVEEFPNTRKECFDKSGRYIMEII